MVKKQITELELSLLHLQRNVEIPEISLNIHPVVRETVKKASEFFLIVLNNQPILKLKIDCDQLVFML